ncbi:MAG: hypothetical protein JNK25_13370 [Phycisphaerae bacterium]|nr:hypothetical protein [Phycisphaerae bacterium]
MRHRAGVVLCTAEVGSGHTRAAGALSGAFRELTGVRVEILDALKHAPAWFVRGYRDGYLAAMSRLPRTAGWLYERMDNAPQGRAGGWMAAMIEQRALTAFTRLGAVREASTLVCTHFVCARVLSAARLKGELAARLCVVVTDQHPHAIWQVEGVDLYVVGTQAAAVTLERRGVAAHRIAVTGIPIDPVFSRPLAKHEARERHRLPQRGPVLLLSGGGLGLGGIDRVVEGLIAAKTRATAIVVCGRNGRLRRELSRTLREHPAGSRFHVVGETSLMHEYMAAADLMVGKPGGLSTAEAAAMRLPMVLLKPIPGQEERNADVLIRAGAALLEPEPERAGRAAAELLEEPDRLTAMSRYAGLIGKPCAALDAAMVISRLSETGESRAPSAPIAAML